MKISGEENVASEEIKILQYGDDTTGTLSDITSAHALFDNLNNFRVLWGLAVNLSKTEGMWIGSLRGVVD